MTTTERIVVAFIVMSLIAFFIGQWIGGTSQLTVQLTNERMEKCTSQGGVYYLNIRSDEKYYVELCSLPSRVIPLNE